MNFLSFRHIESPWSIAFIEFLSLTTKLLSRRTLYQDIVKEFRHHRNILNAELQAHITMGEGLSLTSDAWTARDRDEHAAVTVHWSNEMWEQREAVLNVVHLEEAHTGQYLADKLLQVTDDFELLLAIRTIPRDNAYANDYMLRIIETAAAEAETIPAQPCAFTVEERNVRCMGHIINLAVQDALKTSKADSEEDPNNYHLIQRQASSPWDVEQERHNDTIDSLPKLRRHIFVFMNRKGWTRIHNEQSRAAHILSIKLQFDMPVQWNLTQDMLQ